MTFGNHVVQERTDLELQGPALQLNSGTPAQRPPESGEGETPETTEGQAVRSLVRAVEISLTQPNNQVVTQVFLTGGVY